MVQNNQRELLKFFKSNNLNEWDKYVRIFLIDSELERNANIGK